MGGDAGMNKAAMLFWAMNHLPEKPEPDVLVRELREKAEVEGPGTLATLLVQAANHIEDLERRLHRYEHNSNS